MTKALKLFILSLLILIFPNQARAQTEETIYEAEVTKITNEGQEEYQDELLPFQELELEIANKDRAGQTITIKNSAGSTLLGPLPFKSYSPGDRVRLSAIPTPDGQTIYNIAGELKRPALISLTLVFIVVVLMVGRLWGALSLLGLATSFLVIFKLVIPMIINGVDPVYSAILGAIIIIPTTFYISHGLNKKTTIGVISTLIALIFTGFLAVYFVNEAHLTGFASEEAGFLQVQRQGTIDIRGLLLAGIIIGTLGILDDVTIGQASTAEQLIIANPKISFSTLFQKTMKVGQDHISSMVNTLVLVYSGSALPLLLLFFDSQKTFIDIIEFELIAEEIVRMLVGSIGLVLAAPLATALAAYWYTKSPTAPPKKLKQSHAHAAH